MRRRRSLRLADGTRIRFRRFERLLAKAVLDLRDAGVEWRAGPRSAAQASSLAWFIEGPPGARIIDVPGGIRFTGDSFASRDAGLIFSETFLSKIHFPGFDSQGQVVIDAGAFVGDSALFFASLGARVLALEPNPVNFERLRRNLALNPALAGQITPLQRLVGAEGDVRFSYDPAMMGGGSSSWRGGPAEVITAQSTTLHALLREFGLTGAYLLKMDIKGAEIKVLEEEDLSRFEKVKLEYDHSGRGANWYREQLERQGFRTHVFKHNASHIDLDAMGTVYAERAPAARRT